MIKLDPSFVTTIQTTMGGVTSIATADTLRVSYAELDLTNGNVMVMADQGALVNSVFIPSISRLRIQFNADGTFSSSDGSWSGSIDTSALVAQLKATLDQFILTSGKITGTAA